jgi:hypothetical protein
VFAILPADDYASYLGRRTRSAASKDAELLALRHDGSTAAELREFCAAWRSELTGQARPGDSTGHSARSPAG